MKRVRLLYCPVKKYTAKAIIKEDGNNQRYISREEGTNLSEEVAKADQIDKRTRTESKKTIKDRLANGDFIEIF